MIIKKKKNMVKKQVIIQKGLNLLTENRIILLYHFNNVSTKNWQFIKNEIKKAEDINTLVIQNKIANEILKKIQSNTENKLLVNNKLKKENQTLSVQKKGLYGKNYPPLNELSTKVDITTNKYGVQEKDHLLKHLFQGPTFVLGCKTRNQLVLIYNLLKNSFNFVFVGGSYTNQNISHHSLERIVMLNDSVKFDLIQFLEYKKLSIFLLNSHLIYSCSNLLQILKTR